MGRSHGTSTGAARAHTIVGLTNHPKSLLLLTAARAPRVCVALVRYNLAIECEDEGKAEEALEAYERAVEAKEDFPQAYYNMGLLLEGIDEPEMASDAYR
jgi:tetratricopeptide (TPR) repeat protein